MTSEARLKAVGNNVVQGQVIASLAKAAPVSRANKQLVSAFGERAVETELLRHGWVTANINASIRNVKDVDLFAAKNRRTLHIRVKACSPNEDIQYRTPIGREITTDDIGHTDFTVVVRMARARNDDRFYVVPSRVVLEALAEHRRVSLARGVKDNGHWVLRWDELRRGQSQPNYGFEKKWAEYLNQWDRLEKPWLGRKQAGKALHGRVAHVQDSKQKPAATSGKSTQKSAPQIEGASKA